MVLPSISRLRSLKAKTVLVRVDFNVPMSNGQIREDYRLRAALETINDLLAKGAKLVIITHLGDPGGQIKPNLSLRPVAVRLQQLLKKNISFLEGAPSPELAMAIKKMPARSIIFLENLRFNPGEASNSLKFARALASLGDIYVNEAFSVCHRQAASVVAIKKLLPVYYGRQLIREVENLNRILKPKKPLVVVMGGAKIATKAPLISQIHHLADQILLGGDLANNFFKYQKYEIGRSMVDIDAIKYVRPYFKRKKIDPKIILPIDVVVKTRRGEAVVKAPDKVGRSEAIYDIGPETIKLYASYLKTAQTMIWNGPLGVFEEAPFKHGTISIAIAIASRSSGRAFGLVGGGETVEALNKTHMEQYVDWVSTAGGAMLAYLGGQKLPGLK